MCFYTTEKQKAKVAKKDIICYKVGVLQHNKFTPVVQVGFTYEEKQNMPCVNLFVQDSGEIHEGYHSYSNREISEKYRQIVSMWSGISHTVGVFIIPKDTVYFYNRKRKEYVSETIIWTGQLIKP